VTRTDSLPTFPCQREHDSNFYTNRLRAHPPSRFIVATARRQTDSREPAQATARLKKRATRLQPPTALLKSGTRSRFDVPFDRLDMSQSIDAIGPEIQTSHAPSYDHCELEITACCTKKMQQCSADHRGRGFDSRRRTTDGVAASRIEPERGASTDLRQRDDFPFVSPSG